jgi:hypothetical protein
MGKKGKEREFQERRQIRWYQWEFLRRNPDYKRDYDELMAKFGPWFRKRGFWYQAQRGDAQYTRRESLFYYNKIWPALREICTKWSISDPFPPEWTFDEFGFHAYAPRRFVSLPTGYKSEDAEFLWNTGPVELVRDNRRGAFTERFKIQQRSAKESQGKLRAPDSHLLLLRVDVTRPQKELLPDILSAIRLHRDKLSRAGSPDVTTKRGRRRLDQYSVYIRAWDLRQKGRSFREIAQEIYPKEYPHHPAPRNPITQRVLDHFRRAETLIHGGYKELA